MTVFESRVRRAYLRKRTTGEMAEITANLLAAAIMLALILSVYGLAYLSDYGPFID